MKSLVIAVIIASGSTWANAGEFNLVQSGQSGITFVSRQMGVPVNGKFGKFSAKIAFDPVKPETAKAQIDVDMSSIDAGSDDANIEVKGKDWFSIKEFPTSIFESTSIKAIGGGRYEAAGKMTIKNVTRNVVAPFAAKIVGNTATLDGGIAISRKQYAVGTGEWADDSTVADDVQLHFKIVLGTARK